VLPLHRKLDFAALDRAGAVVVALLALPAHFRDD
jgi:hypothetical protein